MLDKKGVVAAWREVINRFTEENEHESFELVDIHEHIGMQLLEFLEELEAEIG